MRSCASNKRKEFTRRERWVIWRGKTVSACFSFLFLKRVDGIFFLFPSAFVPRLVKKQRVRAYFIVFPYVYSFLLFMLMQLLFVSVGGALVQVARDAFAVPLLFFSLGRLITKFRERKETDKRVLLFHYYNVKAGGKGRNMVNDVVWNCVDKEWRCRRQWWGHLQLFRLLLLTSLPLSYKNLSPLSFSVEDNVGAHKRTCPESRHHRHQKSRTLKHKSNSLTKRGAGIYVMYAAVLWRLYSMHDSVNIILNVYAIATRLRDGGRIFLEN